MFSNARPIFGFFMVSNNHHITIGMDFNQNIVKYLNRTRNISKCPALPSHCYVVVIFAAHSHSQGKHAGKWNNAKQKKKGVKNLGMETL